MSPGDPLISCPAVIVPSLSNSRTSTSPSSVAQQQREMDQSCNSTITHVQGKIQGRPSSMIHPLGSVSAYHTERQGEAYRWDAQLQLWTKVVTVGESETLEGAWLRREWLDVINKKMNPSVGWWCKSKHVPEELVARTQQWVKEHRGDWKKTSADLHRMGVRAEVYQPFYQR
ncbi:hypothetical protein C343_07072 [Cryptococcus neoformans C23]|nr:hypothetical protein C347_06999 [Cryptococcus neoformans var. grubii AD2-60a]OWZ38059.1 hypothetical protein C343_07072 [Cryptococcus neoformans var. grubii C23]